MPYFTRKMPNKKCYRVFKKVGKNSKSKKRVFSKCTTYKKAQKQLRLLRALQYNKKFVPYAMMNTNRTTVRPSDILSNKTKKNRK